MSSYFFTPILYPLFSVVKCFFLFLPYSCHVLPYFCHAPITLYHFIPPFCFWSDYRTCSFLAITSVFGLFVLECTHETHPPRSEMLISPAPVPQCTLYATMKIYAFVLRVIVLFTRLKV